MMGVGVEQLVSSYQESSSSWHDAIGKQGLA